MYIINLMHLFCIIESFDAFHLYVIIIENTILKLFLVSCVGAPRRNKSQEQVHLLDVEIPDASLTLEMTAYPTPYVADVMYLWEVLNNKNKGVMVENTLNVTCHANSSSPSLVICNVSIVNLTNITEGFYTIVFKNSIGELDIVIKIGREGEATHVSFFVYIFCDCL